VPGAPVVAPPVAAPAAPAVAPPAPAAPVAAQAKVRLTMDLKGATVEVDGTKATPAADGTVAVSPGQHKIKVTKEGHKPIEQTVAVSAGSSVDVGGSWEATSTDDGLGPYVTTALGAGLIGLGVVFSVDAGDGESSGPAGAPDTSDDKKVAAAVLYGIGGALVATGITLLVIKLAGSEEDPGSTPKAGLLDLPGGLALTPTVSPDGGGVSAVLRF